MPRTTKPLTPLLSVVLLLSGPAIGQARLPASLPGMDISASERGRDMAVEAAARYRGAGLSISSRNLRVLDLGEAGILIAPADTLDVVTSLSGLNGSHPAVSGSFTVGHRLDAPDGVAIAAEGDIRLAAAAYWSRREGDCFSRRWVDSAWIDVCYEISKLINDNDGGRDFFALENWAYIGETEFGLRHAFIHSARPAGTPWQSWYRASPGSDSTGFCRDVSVSVSVLSATIGGTFEACEGWDMTKSANGANASFKNQWQCNCSFMIGGNRQVAYTITVTVPQGSSPTWSLGWGMAA
jgi:hypothetical protein